MNLKGAIKAITQAFLLLILAWLINYYILYNYIDMGNLSNVLNILLTMIGVLFAGVLTSSAIVLGMLDLKELSSISQMGGRDGADDFFDIITGLKIDIYIIFSSLVILSFLSQYSIDSLHREMFSIANTIFIISCFATYDIVKGLFIIMEIKYEHAKHQSQPKDSMSNESRAPR